MNIKGKWTPGSRKVTQIFVENTPTRYATYAGKTSFGVPLIGVFEIEADAVLDAAAPEMAEALSEVYDMVFNRPRRDVDAISWQEWASKHANALRKARGEER